MPAIGDVVGPYRLKELLGEGGMGSVFLAEREQDGYAQRVALKLVRGRFLDPDMQRRFLDEQRILATFSHPYIAALVDGGTTANGTPYLVMEYIDGEPIDTHCDRLQLDFDARIRLLRKVAVAVQYAHQNLVIHRDLKPSNVLVTADGIPKLLDFGIAKLIEPEQEAGSGTTTVFGRGALTPDYASPEQILDNRVTTASDVYSLGVLAYQLLVGERPYRYSSSVHRELIHEAEQLTVPKPAVRFAAINDPTLRKTIATQRSMSSERLQQRLTGDIANVLMKALDTDPVRRYASVASFSADLDRYLNNLPVEARPDSFAYRLRRFIDRHRAGAAMTAAAIVGFGVAFVLISNAYIQAETAREEASERFEQVREIAKTLMFDVYEEVENIPGSVSARQLLASTAQRYLETLSSGTDAPLDVRFDAAVGYARLTAILDRESVDDPRERDRVESTRQLARQQLESLLPVHDNKATIYVELGKLLNKQSRSQLYLDNDVDATRRTIEQSLAMYEQAELHGYDKAEAAALRLGSRMNYADTFKWENDFEPGLVETDKLIKDITAAIDLHGETHELRFVHADTYELQGQMLYFVDRLDDAIADYDRAIELYQPLREIESMRERVDDGLISAYWSKGNALVDLERADDAVASFDPVIEIIDLRLRRDPADTQNQRTRAIAQGSLALAIVRQGDVERAMQVMLEANRWFEDMAATDTATSGAQRNVPIQYEMTGDLLWYADKLPEACTWYRRALAKWQEIDRTVGISEFDKVMPIVLEEEDLAECP